MLEKSLANMQKGLDTLNAKIQQATDLGVIEKEE